MMKRKNISNGMKHLIAGKQMYKEDNEIKELLKKANMETTHKYYMDDNEIKELLEKANMETTHKNYEKCNHKYSETTHDHSKDQQSTLLCSP